MSLSSTSDLKPVIVSTNNSFLALKSDGTLAAWGKSGLATSSLPSGITNSGFIDIASTDLAFAALNSNGTVISWGKMLNSDGNAEDISNVPTDNDFIKIYSNQHAFAAQKKNSKVKAWGRPGYGGPIYNSSGTDTTLGISSQFYVEVKPYKNGFYGRRYSNAIKTETYAWGQNMNQNVQKYSNSNWGGIGVITKPGTTGAGATRSTTVINYPTKVAFNDQAVAIIYSETPSSSETSTKNGSIAIGGASDHGGLDSTIDFNSSSAKRLYENIYTTQKAFAALNKDGSIISWGHTDFGGSGAPTGTGYSKIYSTNSAFAALKSDGSISVWGDSSNGGSSAPTGTGFTKIFSTATAFAAIKSDGSVSVWGDSNNGGSGAPTGTGFTKIFSNETTFVGLNTDGSVTAWGGGANSEFGASGAPTTSDILTIIPSQYAFTAIKTDGSVVTWGDDSSNTYLGSSSAPSDLAFVTSNFAYKMNGYEMSRWSAIHEINNIDHDLNKVTYYRTVNVYLLTSVNTNVSDQKLIAGKFGVVQRNISNSLTYSMQTSINQGDFTSVNSSDLIAFPGSSSNQKGYYFDISGAAGTDGGILKVCIYATINNINYRIEGFYPSFILPSYDPSTTYDLSHVSITILKNAGYFQLNGTTSNEQSVTGLVSSDNETWTWFKNTSNNSIPVSKNFNLGVNHPLGTSHFSMTQGEKYYIKFGFSETVSATNLYTFLDTIEYTYIPNTEIGFTASTTNGDTQFTLNLSLNSSTAQYFKEYQVKYYDTLQKKNADTPDDTFTISKTVTSYPFNFLTNGNTYYLNIVGFDMNSLEQTTSNVTGSAVETPPEWQTPINMLSDSNYDISSDETYTHTIYADNNYIQYYNNSTKKIKILKKSGSSWNQVTDPFPSANTPSFTYNTSINLFHKSGDYYAYYEQPSSNTGMGYIWVYQQSSDGTMSYINKKQLGNYAKHNELHSFTMYKDDDGNAWITRIRKSSSSTDLATSYVCRTSKFTTTGTTSWTNGYINPETGTSTGNSTLPLYYDYNGNALYLTQLGFTSSFLVKIKKKGETAIQLTGADEIDPQKHNVFTGPNFILLLSGNTSKKWGWVNFNKTPDAQNNNGAYSIVTGTSNDAGFAPSHVNTSKNVLFGSNFIIFGDSAGNNFSKIVNYSDHSSFTALPSSSNSTAAFFRYAYNIGTTRTRTVANDTTIFGEGFTYSSTSWAPSQSVVLSASSTLYQGVSSSDIATLEAVSFTNDSTDSTKSIPDTTTNSTIKSLMTSIDNDSTLSTVEKSEKKRKQRRLTLKVLFNKSRQVKKMVIPKTDLDLPATFTKEKALVVKAGETLKLSDLANDEGAYAVLDDGEEIKYETTNTVLTFTRDDNDLENDREEYKISATTWTDADGEDIVINTDNVTGTFSSDTKDGYLLPGDTFTIDGQLFFIGSVGTGGSGGGSAGDPYIFPFKSNCPVKLPNKKAFYRIFEQGDNYINIEVNQATENHKNRMLTYAKNITPVTHNIVMDGYFYSKLFISAEGHKLSINYLTKKASCDEEALSFFRISSSIERFDCGEFYEDAKCVNIKWCTKENKLIKAQVLFFPNPHIENGINVIPQTLHNSTGLLVDNYKPKLMEIPRLTTEKYGKIQRKLNKSKNIHHKMSIKGKNEKWYFSK